MLAIFAGKRKSARSRESDNSVAGLAREWWNCGRRPEGLFKLVPEDGPVQVCLARKTGGNSAVLLFTTRPFALEYGRAKNLAADVRSIPLLELPAHADSWSKRGLDSFVLDACPRCSPANLLPMATLRSPEQLGYVWAVTLILREQRMQQFAGCAFRSLVHRQMDGIVSKLKEMRDHVDPGCAALHHTLALLSPLETAAERENLLAVCKERLVELGYPALAINIPGGTEGLLLGFARLREMADGNFDTPTPPGKRMAAGAGAT